MKISFEDMRGHIPIIKLDPYGRAKLKRKKKE